MPDFANILFAGPCNRACPFCIGKHVSPEANVGNLDTYPPRGLEAFVDVVNRERIGQIVMTGTTTDPQLYRHEGRLLALLRERLHPHARLSSTPTASSLSVKSRSSTGTTGPASPSHPSTLTSTRR